VLRLARLAVLIWIGCLALRPLPVHADSLTEYFEANQQLDQLLGERETLEASIAESGAAERVAFARLTEVEQKLGRLIGERADTDQRRVLSDQYFAEAEARVPALDAHAAQIERRIGAQEVWLFDGEAPRAMSMRGYRMALDAREGLSADRDLASREIENIRQDQASLVRDLGRLNTEISFYEREGDARSRQVGAMRARALEASARLVTVQQLGTELSTNIRTQFARLKAEGRPIGISAAAQGELPIPLPLQWPLEPPKGYALPAGASAAALKAGDPLSEDGSRQAIASVPALGGAWVAPVKGPITTPYGDATPYQPAHWALDIGTRLYEPVRAATDGVVEFAGLAAGENRLASYGLVIALRHGERVTSVYAHLDDRAHGLAVQPGDMVLKGQVIGYVGLSGYSTGPHLHLEVRLDGQPLDPALLVTP
jgi:murein DD-endopeptidase MepM/ murein hydrolase activator NlpD